MLQCSHHTFNSVFLISAFSTFVMGFRPRFSRPVAFENVQRPQLCNPPGGDIRRARRSAQVFQQKRAPFPRRCGQERIRSVLHTSGSERRGTTLRLLWTNGKYASKPVMPPTFDGNEAGHGGFVTRDNSKEELDAGCS